jgi:hypothetical protein
MKVRFFCKDIDFNFKAPIRLLINAYYSYVKTKARNYAQYSTTFFSKEVKPKEENTPSSLGEVPISFESTQYLDKKIPS